MKLTIIVDDKAVYKDGFSYSNLDLSAANIPLNIHALQWKEDNGWIEYNDGLPNEYITSLPSWTNECLTAWQLSKEEDDLNKDKDLGLENGYDPNNLTPDFVALPLSVKESLFIQDRNQRLSACDWTQLPDVIATKPEKWVNDWKVYRQALRDLTPTDYDNVFFPELPYELF